MQHTHNTIKIKIHILKLLKNIKVSLIEGSNWVQIQSFYVEAEHGIPGI